MLIANWLDDRYIYENFLYFCCLIFLYIIRYAGEAMQRIKECLLFRKLNRNACSQYFSTAPRIANRFSEMLFYLCELVSLYSVYK